MKFFKGSKLEAASLAIRALFALLTIVLIVLMFTIGARPALITAVWVYIISVLILDVVHIMLHLLIRHK